jgi:hypothetical protein
MSEKNDKNRMVLNYRSSGKIAYTADEIPTLVPKGAVAEFMNGDTDPYFKLQRIDYPIKANGVTYVESFFESFLKNLKSRPFAGDKYGHETNWGKRGNTDFILVGGSIEKGENGKGTVYLKNYIPPQGATSSNERFIQECKAGMVHFSIVSCVKQEAIETKNGIEINITESLRGERNDAVDRDTGAMDQITNAEENPVVDGLDNLKNKEGQMDPKEVLKFLADSKAAEITIDDVAKVMNATDRLITKEHTEALAVVNALSEMKITDPVKTIKELQEREVKNAEVVRNAALDKEFGAPGEKNPLRTYADEKVAKNATYDDIMAGIEDVKKSPVAQALTADMADIVKNVGTAEPKGKPTEKPTTTRVDKL